MKSTIHGFTLIELVFVVAIIGVLTMVAYPFYLSHVERVRLTEGQAALLTAAVHMERCFSEQASYIACQLPEYSETGIYRLQLSEDTTANFYRLSAVREKALESDDCGNLVIASTGKRSVTEGDVAHCWQ